MSHPEHEAESALPFTRHELTDEVGRRVWLINANTQAAELMNPTEFWNLILDSRINRGYVARLEHVFLGPDETEDESSRLKRMNDETPVVALDLELRTFFGIR